MEVNVKLEITAEEFFDAIGEAIVYDIQQATGKHVRVKNIKRGMSYTKKANTIIQNVTAPGSIPPAALT